jgi:hypothetical protein
LVVAKAKLAAFGLRESARKAEATLAPATPAQGAPEQVAPEARRAAQPVEYQGLCVYIDRPAGYVQNGVDHEGTPWSRVYHVDYGYIPSTAGGDGDELDVFLGRDPHATDAYWVVQRKVDGSFDEYKLMLGFRDAESAKAMYLAHVPRRFLGEIVTTSLGMVKALLGCAPTEVMKALRGHAVPSPVGGATREVALRKAEGAPLRYVLGVVLEPDTVDAQGDIYSADEIRQAMWGYMKRFRNVGLQHGRLVNGLIHLVESYQTPCEINVGGSVLKPGTWLIGLHVEDDALWADVEAGRLTGLSIGGFARKQPA